MQSKHQSMLVFTRTKHKAKNLARRLSSRGHNATFLQGNMSQNQREKALDGFKTGHFSIMVATDIAARGIDCDRVTHVINFDMPDTVETFTHRIGRTGRAGRSGNAISLVMPDELGQLRAIQRTMNISIDQKLFDDLAAEGGKQEGRKTPSRRNPAKSSSRNQERSSNRNSRSSNRSSKRSSAKSSTRNSTKSSTKSSRSSNRTPKRRQSAA